MDDGSASGVPLAGRSSRQGVAVLAVQTTKLVIGQTEALRGFALIVLGRFQGLLQELRFKRTDGMAKRLLKICPLSPRCQGNHAEAVVNLSATAIHVLSLDRNLFMDDPIYLRIYLS
jgi:hypothetical protein